MFDEVISFSSFTTGFSAKSAPLSVTTVGVASFSLVAFLEADKSFSGDTTFEVGVEDALKSISISSAKEMLPLTSNNTNPRKHSFKCEQKRRILKSPFLFSWINNFLVTLNQSYFRISNVPYHAINFYIRIAI